MTVVNKKHYKELMKEPFVLIICGSPRSGKTYWITNLIKKIKKDPSKKDPTYLIFCGSIFKNRPHDYSFIAKDENAHCTPTFTNEKLHKCLEMIAQHPDKQFFMIFDDMMNDPNMKWNSNDIKNIFAKYRHYGNMSIIIAVQHIKGIPPSIRGTAKFAMVFAQKTKKDKEAVLDSYIDEVDNVKELDEFMDRHNCKLGNHKFIFKYLDIGEILD